jgi:hypothetical protein
VISSFSCLNLYHDSKDLTIITKELGITKELEMAKEL